MDRAPRKVTRKDNFRSVSLAACSSNTTSHCGLPSSRVLTASPRSRLWSSCHSGSAIYSYQLSAQWMERAALRIQLSEVARYCKYLRDMSFIARSSSVSFCHSAILWVGISQQIFNCMLSRTCLYSLWRCGRNSDSSSYLLK